MLADTTAPIHFALVSALVWNHFKWDARVGHVIGRRLTRRVRSLVGACVPLIQLGHPVLTACWAEARIKTARMTLTIKLDKIWNSCQIANSAPPLSVTDRAITPSAKIRANFVREAQLLCCSRANGERMARVRPHWDSNSRMCGTLGLAAFLLCKSPTIW